MARDAGDAIMSERVGLRAVRLIALMQLFEQRGTWSSAELAERMGVTQRTIQRDLLDLQSYPLYFPLVEDERGRYARVNGKRPG